MGSGCRQVELELARGVSRNDDACVSAFFHAYHAGVYRYMMCLTNNREDAEDLAQDSLLQAKAHIRSFRGDSTLKTWVHRVAYHTFTHWKRRSKPHAELDADMMLSDERFGRIDSAQALLTALSRISPTLTQPFVLMEISELSVEEVARILDIPVGTVKSRLSSARQRLRQLLGESAC
jgi:RNA polymerase sigma-70 factor (ECF subfamily)